MRRKKSLNFGGIEHNIVQIRATVVLSTEQRCDFAIFWLVKAAVFEFNLFLSLDWYLCLTFLLLYSYARKASPTYEPYRR